MQTQAEKVNRYYEASALDYRLFWTGGKDLAMHFGYYDSPKVSHVESLLAMNRVLAEKLGIQAEDRVLDAGCGFGGSALWLAEHIGCHVVGLNIVPLQIERARRSAEEKGLSALVSFRNEDYAHTTFPGGSFSVIWGLESIVHSAEKGQFLKEAYRLLSPGGRIVISEYLLRDAPPLSENERGSIREWLTGWAMPDLLTPSQYRTLFETAGFEKFENTDVTSYVLPSLNRLKRLLTFGLPLGRLFRSLGIFSETHLGNISASQKQMDALEQGLWRYTILTAQKPR